MDRLLNINLGPSVSVDQLDEGAWLPVAVVPARQLVDKLRGYRTRQRRVADLADRGV